MLVERVLITGGSGFIGTNLVEHFSRMDADVMNVDIVPPRNPEHGNRWLRLDIRDGAALTQAISKFAPHYVFHFAARADLVGKSAEYYDANTQGVANVVEAAAATPGVRRVIFASSLMVCRLGYRPADEQDYAPNTVYGESKVVGERIVRDRAADRFPWIIVRPTSIWGPWFDVPYRSFFDAVRQGWYLHPRNVAVSRSYGFVLNSVYQLERLMRAEERAVRGRVFYVGDYEPIELGAWAEEIQKAFGAPQVRRVPLALLQAAARVGDILRLGGMRDPPLTSFRLRNLTTEAVYDMTELHRVCGDTPYRPDQGVKITVDWMRQQGQARRTPSAAGNGTNG